MYWLPWLLTLPVFTHWADVGEPILVMYFGYTLWLVGCALGMFSHITGVVETVRVLEGLGSAATFGCCVVILAKIQDGTSEKGSRWSKFWLATLRGLFWGGWSSCVVMGALVGEITLKRLDWHALYVIMLVTVGVQLGTLLFCKGFSWFYVTNDIITPPNLDKGGGGRIDVWGTTLYLGNLACFLLWMLFVSHVVPWDKPGVVTTILCGTVFGLGLIVQQLQRPCHSALLPLRPDGYQWTLVVYVLGVFTSSTLLFAIVAHWHHYLIFVAVSSWKLSLAFILPLWVTAGVLGWGAVVASVTWGIRTMSIVLTVAVTCLVAATSILAFTDIGSASQSLTWSSITLSGLGLGVALPTFFTLGQRRNSDSSCSIPATRLLLVVLSLGGWTGLWFQSMYDW
ncbi:hypothetical protein IWQ61_001001 [Dispira simplex]|nr:hypothetical protein IWQ61_001001 [Dispira simplex]